MAEPPAPLKREDSLLASAVFTIDDDPLPDVVPEPERKSPQKENPRDDTADSSEGVAKPGAFSGSIFATKAGKGLKSSKNRSGANDRKPGAVASTDSPYAKEQKGLRPSRRGFDHSKKQGPEEEEKEEVLPGAFAGDSANSPYAKQQKGLRSSRRGPPHTNREGPKDSKSDDRDKEKKEEIVLEGDSSDGQCALRGSNHSKTGEETEIVLPGAVAADSDDTRYTRKEQKGLRSSIPSSQNSDVKPGAVAADASDNRYALKEAKSELLDDNYAKNNEDKDSVEDQSSDDRKMPARQRISLCDINRQEYDIAISDLSSTGGEQAKQRASISSSASSGPNYSISTSNRMMVASHHKPTAPSDRTELSEVRMSLTTATDSATGDQFPRKQSSVPNEEEICLGSSLPSNGRRASLNGQPLASPVDGRRFSAIPRPSDATEPRFSSIPRPSGTPEATSGPISSPRLASDQFSTNDNSVPGGSLPFDCPRPWRNQFDNQLEYPLHGNMSSATADKELAQQVLDQIKNFEMPEEPFFDLVENEHDKKKHRRWRRTKRLLKKLRNARGNLF